jgi:hypothetical protein
MVFHLEALLVCFGEGFGAWGAAIALESIAMFPMLRGVDPAIVTSHREISC